MELPLFDFERWVMPGETVPINAFKPRAVDAVAAAGVMYHDQLVIIPRGERNGVVCTITASQRENMQGINVLRIVAKATARFELDEIVPARELPPGHPARRFDDLIVTTGQCYEDVQPDTPLGVMMGHREFENIPEQMKQAKVLIGPFTERHRQNSLWQQQLTTAGEPDLDDPIRLSFWLMTVLLPKLTPQERGELFISRSTTRRLALLLERFEISPPILERPRTHRQLIRDDNSEQQRWLARQGGFRKLKPDNTLHTLTELCLRKSEEVLDDVEQGLEHLSAQLLQEILNRYSSKYVVQPSLLRRLAQCPQLLRLKLIGEQVTDDLVHSTLAEANFHQLEHLCLWSAYRLQSPSIVPILLRFQHLTKLSLDRCKTVGDDVIVPLIEGLPELKAVALQGTKITVRSLRALALHARKLVELDVSSMPFINDDLATELFGPESAFYPQLESLIMDQAKISHIGARHLSAHRGLTRLSLSLNTNIRDWSFIQELSLLTELNVALNAHLDGEMFSPLCQALTNLTYLDASRAGLDQDAIDGLALCSQLRVLNLERTDVGNDLGRALRNMPHLEAVLLTYTRVTSALANDLAQLSQLRVLKLTGCNWDDSGVATLAQSPDLALRLESLNVGGAGITDNIAPHILALSALQRLQLWETAVSPGCAQQLVARTPMVLDDQIRCSAGTWMLIIPERLG
eukprot:TRINITY_DN6116_c0_g1_i1.p1 TRINITY_DN6116_c0_g1~~TRINITY_DN6116_c0_g1_i1.p1  ORF type:complete len:744 (+),score=141.97 TRINITY_DN6116_c0_g1_i1:163-2232(+)